MDKQTADLPCFSCGCPLLDVQKLLLHNQQTTHLASPSLREVHKVNQWLWSPRSFLLQDFLCVRIVARHTVANMMPPHHCTIEYSGVTNLDIYHWWIYNSYKIGPGKTVESHKEMLLCSSALPSFSGDRLGVKNQRIIDCQWTQARTRALTEWKEWWLLKSLYPPGIYQIDSKNGQI